MNILYSRLGRERGFSVVAAEAHLAFVELYISLFFKEHLKKLKYYGNLYSFDVRCILN